MDAKAAGQWLAIAATALAHIPEDLLADACKAAQLKCQFKNELVPFISDHVGARLASRHQAQEWHRDAARIAQAAKPTWQPKPGELEQIKLDAANHLSTQA